MTDQSQGQQKRYVNNLRIVRVIEGLSQDALAAKIQVDPAIVGRIERGVIRGTPEQRRQIARILGVPETQLFSVSKPENQE